MTRRAKVIHPNRRLTIPKLKYLLLICYLTKFIFVYLCDKLLCHYERSSVVINRIGSYFIPLLISKCSTMWAAKSFKCNRRINMFGGHFITSIYKSSKRLKLQLNEIRFCRLARSAPRLLHRRASEHLVSLNVEAARRLVLIVEASPRGWSDIHLPMPAQQHLRTQLACRVRGHLCVSIGISLRLRQPCPLFARPRLRQGRPCAATASRMCWQ